MASSMDSSSPADHLGLVRSIALKYLAVRRRNGGPREELLDSEEYSVGTLGLLHAAERFDPTRGTSFSTYACRCIECYILTAYSRQRTKGRKPTGIVLQIDYERMDSPEFGYEDASLAHADNRMDCEAALRHARPRDAHVLLGRAKGRTLGCIAGEIGLSKMRVKQLWQRGVEDVRKGFNEGSKA